MAKILYNYDHNIKGTLLSDTDCEAVNFSGFRTNTEPDVNIKGETIGIKAKRNSSFKLFFYIDGEINSTDMNDIIPQATFDLDIYNFRHKLVTSIQNVKTDYNYVEFNVTANDSGEDGALQSGIYYMRVTMIYASGAPAVVIYDENSGKLSIV